MQEQPRQYREPLEAVGQPAAEEVSRRERGEHHANLAYPNVEGTAEIAGQKPGANNLQHHDGKPAQEDNYRSHDAHDVQTNQTRAREKARRARVSLSCIPHRPS